MTKATFKKIFIELDAPEMMCRLIEAASDGQFKRPEGLTATQAILRLEEIDQEKWARVCLAVMQYYQECAEKASHRVQ